MAKLTEELTGLPSDENCLHCHLPGVIDRWYEAHPNKEDQQILIEVAQVLGELLGSSLIYTKRVECLNRVLMGLMGVVRNQAQDIITAVQAREGRQS